MSKINLSALFHTPINFKDWEDIVSFRPSHDIQRSLQGRTPLKWYIHKIEDALGPINLDYYPVTVSTLPIIGGHRATAADFLSHIRKNLNKFIDTNIADIESYDTSEGQRWESSSPLKAVMTWNMKVAGSFIGYLGNLNDGSVVVSEFRPQHWIFSTIWTPRDLDHPVSGNRQFGFIVNEDNSYTFYTRGADRTTNEIAYRLSTLAFGSAHQLWFSLQGKITQFVNSNNGNAASGQFISTRENWKDIRDNHYYPVIEWL
jgi:hypothetical protein